MARDLSRSERRRGRTALFLGGAVLALVLIAVAFVWPWMPSSDKADRLGASGSRSDQVKGSSTAARQSPAPPDATSNTTPNPETVGRAHDIEANASKNGSLTEAQQRAVSVFVEQHKSEAKQPNFTVSVGAAVPRQIELKDLPTPLTDTLAAYNGDQFYLAPSQLIVVERQTRRIVAIIPSSG